MPWVKDKLGNDQWVSEEMAATLNNTGTGNTGTYSPSGSAPQAAVATPSTPSDPLYNSTYTPGNNPAANQLYTGSKVLYADDIPVAVDENHRKDDDKWWNQTTNQPIGPNLSGTYIRRIHFEDGTIQTFRYSIVGHPENWNGQNKDWVPSGAEYVDTKNDPTQQTSYDRRQELEFNRVRAQVADRRESASVASSQATETGYVYRADEQGNINPVLSPEGKPIPTVAREQLDLATQREARATSAQERANTIAEEQNRIAQERQSSEAIYNQKRLEADKERDRINGLVSIGTLSATQARDQFNQWLETNVKLPFQQMEEARARAAEARQAQQMEDKRRQEAATFEQNRETTALGQGTEAIRAAVSTLPYMSGPAWGDQFGKALSAVAQGNPKGIHFDAAGLNFKAPDFQAIAEQATARALAHLSPYAAAIAQAGDRPGGGYTTGDYTGTTIPTAPTTAQPAPYNASGIINQIQSTLNTPSAPPIPQGMTAEQNQANINLMPSEQWR